MCFGRRRLIALLATGVTTVGQGLDWHQEWCAVSSGSAQGRQAARRIEIKDNAVLIL
ncbi:hypothetical protein MCEMIH15_00361 [Caulobacteraceae bacterium]